MTWYKNSVVKALNWGEVEIFHHPFFLNLFTKNKLTIQYIDTLKKNHNKMSKNFILDNSNIKYHHI